MTVGKTQHKISAYADDLLFSLMNPVISLPNLVKSDVCGNVSASPPNDAI